MAKFEKGYLEFLDSLTDDQLLGYLVSQWTETWPIYEPCTKEEYEKNNPVYDIITTESLSKMIEQVSNIGKYRRVPIWHLGGGILDQISGKEPDEYRYEKRVGEKRVILVGGAMMDYIVKRGLIEKFHLKT